MKKILCLLVVLVFCSTVVFAATQDDSLNYIKEKGEFVLGLDDSFPPMGFRDKAGEIVGFDIDLAREVCQRLGVKLRMQPIDWNAKILDLNSKDIDVIWNGLTITDERREMVEFSKPYIANRQIIIVKAGSGIDVKADLAGKIVGIQMGSSADDAVKSDAKTMDSLGEIVKFEDNVQALMDLEIGRLDAVVVDAILGRYYISKKEGVFAVATDFFTEEEYGIGFRKGEVAFVTEVDRILDEMAKDGAAAAISKKWFGEDVMVAR